jgi:hypothetical protein
MSSQKIVAHSGKLPLLILLHFFFLLFILVSCGGGGDGSFAFPSPKPDVWCTYDVSFNEGTSPAEIEKQLEALKNDIQRNTPSSDRDINCEPTATSTKVDDLHYQVEVTMHCFRVSDTSSVRPPVGTKPPPGRVTDGTVKQSGCPDDAIKK